MQRNTAILMASLKEKSTRKEFIQDIVILILLCKTAVSVWIWTFLHRNADTLPWMKTSGDGVEVEAEVTNTGETFSGKEVVQVYVSLPQDDQGRNTVGWLALQKQNF